MATTLQDRALQLQEPLASSGVASVNFFNGRLLAGGDFLREQQARREFDQRLGLAVGDGVAFGLEVGRDPDLDTPSAPVLRVQPGLAINRRGQTLRLLARTAVALTRRFNATANADCQCSFTPCEPVAEGSYVAGAGVYLLTITPAQQATGRAPSNALDPNNVRCNIDTLVEAPQFRLITVSPLRYADLDIGSPRFRNRLAYRCFGIDAREHWAVDPWREDPSRYGLLDQLRALSGAAALSDAEVPLALIYWTAQGLQFIDMWAVRRRAFVAERTPSGQPLATKRRMAEGAAMCAQFQEQIVELVAPTLLPAAVSVASRFRYLPPAGLLPVPEETDDSDAAATHFFSGMQYRAPTHIHGAQLEALLAECRSLPPIDTDADEMIWLYRVRENRMAIELGAAPRPTGYLVFASGHLIYRADARYDLARFDFGNYALTP